MSLWTKFNLVANLTSYSILIGLNGAFRSERHYGEKPEAGNSQASKWKLPDVPEPGNSSCLLEGWRHTGQLWNSVYPQVHQLTGMTVEGTWRGTEKPIFFYLSPNYYKKSRSVGVSFVIQANQCSLQITKSLSVKEYPVNLKLNNHTTQWTEWTWQDSLAFLQTILGHC